MIQNTDDNQEIRCPYCFSFISLTQNKKDNLNLITHCENCGNKNISLDTFITLIQKSKFKSCNFCYKTFQTKEMLYSLKDHTILCNNCYFILLKQQLIMQNDYIYFSEIGKNCLTHKLSKNLFFCESCDRHLCSQCLTEHQCSLPKIINLRDEAKNNYNIEAMKFMIKQEEKEIESEEKFGQELLNSMIKIFKNDIKNRNDLSYFKKIVYWYFISNCNNYITHENVELLFNKENNPDFFINDKNLKELNKILNDIDKDSAINNINKIDTKKNNSHNFHDVPDNYQNNYNKMNLSKEEIDKRRAISDIKQSRINSLNKSKFSNKNNSKTPCKINSKTSYKINNNKWKNSKPKFINNRNRNLYALVTPIKSQRTKNKKFIEKSNDIINKQIQNNNSQFFFSRMNNILSQDKKNNESLSLIQNLNNSIIRMMYLGLNKILISVFSLEKNLILTELAENKEFKNKINMNVLTLLNVANKPIIFMDILEDEYILSCTDEKVIIFKILGKKLFVKNIFAIGHISSCIVFDKEKFLVLRNSTKENINEIFYYFHEQNSKSLVYKRNVIEIPKEYKVISIESISNGTCVLILQKVNYLNNDKNKLYLKIMNVKNNKITFSKENEFIFKEREKMKNIFIRKLFDKHIIISESTNSFLIYDYQNGIIKNKIQCENVISSFVKQIDSEQIYLYTIENKENDEKLMEEMKIKKYLIKKINKNLIILGNNVLKYEIEINAISSCHLLGYNKNNKINDMLVINDDNRDEKDKNGSDKNLILLADNTGNVFYKYY